MPRVCGVDIPREKKIKISLSYIYGVGRANALDVLTAAQVDPEKRAKELRDEEISRIVAVIQERCKIEGDLRRDVSSNIKRLIDIGAYRGLRHRRGLPVRGQRTHTNARTRKGPRRLLNVRRPEPSAPAKATPKTT